MKEGAARHELMQPPHAPLTPICDPAESNRIRLLGKNPAARRWEQQAKPWQADGV
jgi:hypothetical protein